jgi:two-component system LytT family response regulator
LCDDLPSGIKAINKCKPDLVFLDIEMPGHSGLEILDFFEADDVGFRIIFTTAYSEYAIQAFRFSAIDYLLKPIKQTQLIDAVKRFETTSGKEQIQMLKVLQHNLDGRQDWRQKRITLSTHQGLFFISPADIIMIKGESAYSDFYLCDGKRLLVSKNLKYFEDVLSKIPLFFRCHKSFIINLSQAVRYIRSEGSLELMHQKEALVSPDRVDELLARMETGFL